MEPAGAAPSGNSPDLIRALSTAQFLDFLGIRLDPQKAEGHGFTANLITPDNGEQFAIELSNGTLTSLQGFLVEDPDLTLTIDRADLERAMIGVAPLAKQVAEGTARLDGNPAVLMELAGMLVHFELDFEILRGTGGTRFSPDLDAFAQDPLAESAGG